MSFSRRERTAGIAAEPMYCSRGCGRRGPMSRSLSSRKGIGQLVIRAAFVLSFFGLILAPAAALAQRGPVETEHSLVTSASALASQVGADILKRGGNAADAAV